MIGQWSGGRDAWAEVAVEECDRDTLVNRYGGNVFCLDRPESGGMEHGYITDDYDLLKSR